MIYSGVVCVIFCGKIWDKFGNLIELSGGIGSCESVVVSTMCYPVKQYICVSSRRRTLSDNVAKNCFYVVLILF